MKLTLPICALALFTVANAANLRARTLDMPSNSDFKEEARKEDTNVHYCKTYCIPWATGNKDGCQPINEKGAVTSGGNQNNNHFKYCAKKCGNKSSSTKECGPDAPATKEEAPKQLTEKQLTVGNNDPATTAKAEVKVGKLTDAQLAPYGGKNKGAKVLVDDDEKVYGDVDDPKGTCTKLRAKDKYVYK